MSELHEKQFRGYWIPAYVVELFEQDTINAKELILLSVIDSLAKTNEGCFASNKYLGEKIKVSGDRTQRMIAHLRELRLISELAFDGRKRYLETYWSRNPSKELVDQCQNTESDQVEIPGQTRQKYLGRPGESTVHINKGYKIKNNRGRLTSSPPAREGFLDISFCDKGASRLMNILIKYESDLIQPPRRLRLSSLSKNFSHLLIDRQISKERIKQVVRWLEDHYGDEFTPKMHKVDDFGRNFKRYEDAMNRNRRDNGEAPPPTTREQIIEEFHNRIMELQDSNGRNPFTSDILQSEIDEVTKQMGLPAGSVRRTDLPA